MHGRQRHVWTREERVRKRSVEAEVASGELARSREEMDGKHEERLREARDAPTQHTRTKLGIIRTLYQEAMEAIRSSGRQGQWKLMTRQPRCILRLQLYMSHSCGQAREATGTLISSPLEWVRGRLFAVATSSSSPVSTP